MNQCIYIIWQSKNHLITLELGNIGLGRFCTDFAAIGLYCHDHGSIFLVRPSCSLLVRGFNYIICWLFQTRCKLLSALLVPNWNITVENTTTRSIKVNWKNLTPVINKMVLYYIVQMRNENGSDVLNALVVNGSATYVDVAGLSPYTEYQVSVVGVSSDGQPYKSPNVTALTEEGGIVFLFVMHQYHIMYFVWLPLREYSAKNNWSLLRTSNLVYISKNRCLRQDHHLNVWMGKLQW